MAVTFLKDKLFLIVDDEQTTIEIVKEILLQNGAKSTGITHPEDGFGMMAQEKYDGVILDRYMGDVDGHEILEQLKAHPKMKDIPVIMLTSESRSEEIMKSISLGASGYIVKPFTPKSFMAQLEKIYGLEG